MKISTRGRYAVRAVWDLAENQDERAVSVKSIAERQEISPSYIDQIFLRLRNGGIIRSVRGAGGGYFLTRPPDQITIGDIIRESEGPIILAPCADNNITENECSRLNRCKGRQLWRIVNHRINEVFDSITLEACCRFFIE